MNWVGGSRNRLVMKNNARKQREFFEKRKMQQKLKDLGLALPASPQGTSSGSMDMVTLFIVNQIATKKENKDPPKVTVLGSYRGRSKHKRNEHLVLPMSPCSPSQLSLVESQSQYSAQGTRKRKCVIPQQFKCRQLSPVLESAFSDNSASDYLPPIADTLSPFSSTSSASSRQGVFPLQLNHQQRSHSQAKLPNCFPSFWDTSGLEQTKFQPFSQPRGMTGDIPWSCGSYLSLCQQETNTAAQVMFGCSEPDKTKVRGSGRPEVRFSLSQPEDKEPTLDFKLYQSETEYQFEEDVFSGFSNDECERKGSAKSKIYLQDETPVRSSTPQTVPDSQCMGGEHSNSTYTNFLHPGHNTGPMNGCECLPSFSCREGCLSSDSDDDEHCCQPCPQASASSYMHQACFADTPNLNQCSQEKPEQRQSQTTLTKPQMNLRDYQKVIENVACPDKACETNDQQIGRSTAQFVSPRPLSQTQSSGFCKCKQVFNETRDVGTQTVDILTAEKRDASTQCNSVTSATAFNLYLPPVVKPLQHLATGRQTDTAAEPNTHSASSDNPRSGGKHTAWNNKSSMAHSLPGSSSSVKLIGGKVTIQQPTIQFPDVQSIPDGRGKESGEGSAKQEQDNGPLMKNLSYEGKEEVTSSTRVKRLSQEAETLQEIADILLLLKQKKEG